MKIPFKFKATTRLGQLREMAGYSQRSFAKRVGMAHPNWHRVERGLAEPSLVTARRASEALGITLDAFYYEWVKERGDR